MHFLMSILAFRATLISCPASIGSGKEADLFAFWDRKNARIVFSFILQASVWSLAAGGIALVGTVRGRGNDQGRPPGVYCAPGTEKTHCAHDSNRADLHN